jgi:hypothetical protein
VARFSDYMVADDLAAGLLVELFPGQLDTARSTSPRSSLPAPPACGASPCFSIVCASCCQEGRERALLIVLLVVACTIPANQEDPCRSCRVVQLMGQNSREVRQIV